MYTSFEHTGDPTDAKRMENGERGVRWSRTWQRNKRNFQMSARLGPADKGPYAASTFALRPSRGPPPPKCFASHSFSPLQDNIYRGTVRIQFLMFGI